MFEVTTCLKLCSLAPFLTLWWTWGWKVQKVPQQLKLSLHVFRRSCTWLIGLFFLLHYLPPNLYAPCLLHLRADVHHARSQQLILVSSFPVSTMWILVSSSLSLSPAFSPLQTIPYRDNFSNMWIMSTMYIFHDSLLEPSRGIFTSSRRLHLTFTCL